MIKTPDKSTLLFDAEVDVIQKLPQAASYGFVNATVVVPDADLKRAIPSGVPNPAQVIVMPKLDGVLLLDAPPTSFDPHIISATIIDCASRLVNEGWYITDCKLENIQLVAENKITFLDWGSLCHEKSNSPVFTFFVSTYQDSPRICMSLSVVITTIEVFGGTAPKNSMLTVEEYRNLVEDALSLLRDPYKERLRRLLSTLL